LAGLGWQELLIVFAILLLLFGATQLPRLSRSLGQSISGFKKGLREDPEESRKREGETGKDSTPGPAA
jgi:sec-independent protein translocase protein TatA